MAQLAIRGHATRGKEVIEILEILGGINSHNLYGDDNYAYYTIDSDNEIKGDSYVFMFGGKQLCHFTLEQFEKKYPHKVGDKVCFPDDLSTSFTINKMWWDENANELLCSFAEDDIEVPVNGVRAYKEESIDEANKVVFDANAQCCDIMNNLIKEETMETDIHKGYYTTDEETKNKSKKVAWFTFWDNDFADKVELDLSNRELIQEDGKWFVVKKKKEYPKTYEECYQYLGYDDRIPIKIIGEFIRLINARNAYWKIAGEQLGLEEPWQPD